MSAWTAERAAGSLLVASLVIGLLALVILIASGALPAFSASLRGSLAEWAPYANTFRLLTLLWAVGWIVQLLGLGLLTHLLLRAGDGYLAVPAFLAILVAAILGILHATFHMSVETWAAQEAARTGGIPEVYEPLRAWVSDSFRVAYITHLVAMAGFGWAILRAGFLTPWVGWTAIGWSLLWLAVYPLSIGAPGILLIMPAVIGAALLLTSRHRPTHEPGVGRVRGR